MIDKKTDLTNNQGIVIISTIIISTLALIVSMKLLVPYPRPAYAGGWEDFGTVMILLTAWLLVIGIILIATIFLLAFKNQEEKQP